jgi:pyrroline-5-carboxylate reductase
MTHVLLVGCGKMGSALLANWHKAYAGRMQFSVISRTAPRSRLDKVTYYTNLADIPASITPDVIVLAVKPQQLDAVLPEYAKRFSKPAILFLSVAAGKTVEYFKSQLGAKSHTIRAMPNTPATIGRGMTVLFAPSDVPSVMHKTATELMSSCGDVASIDDESLMDAAAAISGSGPAYVFYFLDCLTQAGVRAGLDQALAHKLALRTVSGAAALASNSEESFEQLRQNVTSPGGMTEAALQILMADKGLEPLIDEAVQAAKLRAKQL